MDRMTTSAAQADAFYREVLEHRVVWSIRDNDGFPAPQTSDGRAMPFWSLRSRAERIVNTVPAYQGFDVEAIPLDEWRSRWLPGLQRDGLRAGLNWSRPRATGYDLPAGDVERNLQAREGGQELE